MKKSIILLALFTFHNSLFMVNAQNTPFSCGYGHTLAIDCNGTVKAWGQNDFGELGDGTTGSYSIPHAVTGLSGIVSVSAGYEHSLALRNDGTVYSWGKNNYGQLGLGDIIDRHTPVLINGLTNVISVSAGANYSMALKSDGTVVSWGINNYGVLGDGTDTNRYTPVTVIGLTDIIAVDAGGYVSVALKNDGTVWAWGRNNYGGIGIGTFGGGYTALPLQVHGPGDIGFLNNIISVAGIGEGGVALRNDSTVWTWGYNLSGTIGDGTTVDKSYPVQVVGVGGSGFLSGITAISKGTTNHVLALKNDSTVVGWGANYYGQLGDSTTSQRTSPVAVSNLTGVSIIEAGWGHSAALKSDGTLKTWGYNDSGQLGNMTETDSHFPIAVSGNFPSATITASGSTFFCPGDSIILSAPLSTSYLWNPGGETTQSITVSAGGTYNVTITPILCVGSSSIPSPVIVTVNPFNTIVASAGTNGSITPNGTSTLACGASQTYIITPDPGYIIQDVLVDGVHNVGAIINGSYTFNNVTGPHTIDATFMIPISTPSINTIISCGGYHTLALACDGTVESWGSNFTGQLGDGTTISRINPVTVTGLGGIISVSAGRWHSLALKNNGTVFSWGDNNSGALGIGTFGGNSTTPVQVSNLTNAISVSAGSYHNIALKSDSTVVAWGNNGNGLLGDGTTTNRNIPVSVIGLSGVIAVDAGYYVSIALKNDGTVWTWGDNLWGDLGIGTYGGNSLVPVQVHGPENVGFLNNIVSVAAGADGCVALRNDGTVWTWGSDVYGQLGAVINSNQSVYPVQVAGVGSSAFLAGITAISKDNYLHVFALKNDSTLVGWGRNDFGSLGDSTTINRRIPVIVSGLNGVIEVSAGESHSIALKSDGSLKTWGYNLDGELGNGTNINSLIPVDVAGSFPYFITPATPVVFCAGDSVILTAPASSSYLWNPGGDTTQSITVNSSGIFNVTIVPELSICAGSSMPPSVTVTENPLPAIPIINLAGNVFTSTTAPSYQWLLNGADIFLANNQNYAAFINGIYSVTVTDSNGCSATSAPLSYNSSGIHEYSNGYFVLGPNPTSGVFTLSVNSEQGTKNIEKLIVEIYNVLGNKVLQSEIRNSKSEISLESFRNGMYFVRVVDVNSTTVYSQRVVKE